MSFLRKQESRKGGKGSGFPIKLGMTRKENNVIPAKAGNQITMKQYYVYILASKRNGTIYIGVTSDLIKRVFEHKNKLISGFTSKYNVNILVYFETFGDIEMAIRREKQLKKWNRKWKLAVIEKENPKWEDLFEGLL